MVSGDLYIRHEDIPFIIEALQAIQKDKRNLNIKLREQAYYIAPVKSRDELMNYRFLISDVFDEKKGEYIRQLTRKDPKPPREPSEPHATIRRKKAKVAQETK